MLTRAKIAAKKPETKRENAVSRSRNTEPSQSIGSPIDRILFLQRTIGNQAVQRLFKSGVIQAKLRIGQPNDIYEQEADQVAGQVMRLPENTAINGQPLVVRKEDKSVQTKPITSGCPSCKEDLIQPKPFPIKIIHLVQRQPLLSCQASEVTPDIEARINILRGGGQPLPESIRTFFETRFDHDFSHVRVHTDVRAAESTRAVNARAYTVGRDVVFGEGQYSPHTEAGKRLLAHELTHTLQQNGAVTYTNFTSGLHSNQSEREAGRVAELMGKFGRVRPYYSGVMQRKLSIHSKQEAQAFKWLLTPNDAANFQYAGKKGKPLEVTMTIQSSAKIDDAFRFNILKTIINDANERLIIRGFDLDAKVTPHQLFKNGKLNKSNVSLSLRKMAGNILGAGGITIPSKSLALKSNNTYSGPVTGVANESWIFYSTPTSLAHEFGHAFLLFSGTDWKHGGTVPKTAGILTPEGKPFEGAVDVFIKNFVAEKYAELTLFDPEALHFSPTVVRTWPEPPGFKLTFTGTWIQFLTKYPGSTVKQEVKEKKGKKIRTLKICVPRAGEICPP